MNCLTIRRLISMSEKDAVPKMPAQTRTGGQILIEALRRQGVDRIYCVPGESYLPVLDALVDAPEIAVVSARHEGAAANMAEADGKLTGRPGICMVTRGPGATHAAIGVHTAFQDSTPMILFIGQVARSAKDREGFQEVDFRAMFAPLAKWAAEIDDPARIPEYLARAFRVALSGRAGPVVLSLPEDMLSEVIPAPVLADLAVAAGASVRESDLQTLHELLANASRPLLVVGGTGWTAGGCQALLKFARNNELPIVASFRRQDLIDNRDANYCGHLGLGVDPSLAERLRLADVIVSIGSRLGENTTNGYTLLTPPVPVQTLVHVYSDPNELGRVYQPKLAIACGVSDFADAVADMDVGAVKRSAWLKEAREAYVKFSTPSRTPSGTPSSTGSVTPAPKRDFVNMSAVMGWLSEHLPDDAILCNGAGNYTVWVHRFFQYKQPRTELAPVSGAMGYGLPAAIAAKLRFPNRSVVALAGDGCFMMYPQELATARQHNVNVVILVVNNGVYGTIRMHQERRYPGRAMATDLVNPDMVALALSFGAFAERVDTTAGFAASFQRAMASGRPALLDLQVDPAQISPTFRLPSRGIQ
jgi:acetolactate synthase-1/2/3 large subunit